MLCLATLWLINVAAARADTTVNVNTTNGASPMGDGLCSLPEAVTYADTMPGPGTPEPDCIPGTPTGTTTIKVPADATKYTVPATLSITRNTTIDGGGASSTTIDGGGAVQVLNIANTAQVTISGVTISGGLSGASTMGCTSSGFFSSCPMENGLPGGGIANAGTLTLQSSTVTGNSTAVGTRPFTFPFVICFTFPSCPGRAGDSAGAGGDGGGIYNQALAQITIADSTIAGNTAGNGGNGTDGTAATGTDTSAGEPGGSGGDGGSGGGLYNDSGAAATIIDSTIAGNAAGNAGSAGAGGAATIPGPGGDAGFAGFGGSGGGILNLGTLTVTGSTVAANVTGVGGNGANGAAGDGAGSGFTSSSGNGGSGGGILSSSSTTVTLSNSTLAGNTASAGGTGGTGPGIAGSGGGIDQTGLGLVALAFVTIDGNQAGAGGGLFHSSVGSVTEAASIIASNTGSPAANCGGPMVTDDGNNLVFGDNSCPGTPGVPKLSPLADNGGPTQTMALQAGSNAVDLVPTNACPQTTDQRGATRPQGTACDAGAYELAPPSVSGVAGTVNSTTTASVTANVNPNLRSTTVTVSYGPTTAYGSTTPPQTFEGNTSSLFSASLTGLTPKTTYHARVTASNGDGTTNTADLTFTTPAIPPVPPPPPPPPPLTAAVVRASTSAAHLSLTIACGGGSASDRRRGPITLTSRVTARAGQTVAVAAGADKAKRKPKPKPKTTGVRVAAGSYSVASGHQVKIKLALNAAGRKVLTQRYQLPATLVIGGTTRITRSVTFSYRRISSPVSFTWSFNSRFSVAEDLSITRLPPKAEVVVICQGRGCPFSERTFHPTAKKLALAPALAHRHLAPHATVELQINSRNEVGKVLVFAIRSNRQPTLTVSCLAPGASHPTACA